MQQFTVRGSVEKFPGKNGWTYLPFSKKLSGALGPAVRAHWPARSDVEE